MSEPEAVNRAGDRRPLTVEVCEPAPAVALVRACGELDADGAATLDDALDRCLAHPRPYRLLLDLSRIDQLCPEGLQLLLDLRRRCRAADTHLLLVGTGSGAAHRPLLTSGLLPLFETRPTPESAISEAPRSRHEPVTWSIARNRAR
jgi:anti-anti-sigma factor